MVAVALVASACGDDDDVTMTEALVTSEVAARSEAEDPVTAAEARVEQAESGVTEAQTALEAAGDQFCVDAGSYVEVVDRYGKLFTDDAATVGDIQTLGADLVEPRETVASSVLALEEAKTALAAARQELADAQAALAEAIATASSVPTSSTTPSSTTTTTLVPPATVERVQRAEADLARTGEGLTAATPLAEATAEYNSAAFALQIAWLRLLSDAGCLTDDQQAEAVEQVTAYTATLQTELRQVGYDAGPIDGIYGPDTVAAVKALQADSGLPETGFVDKATAEALDALLAELDRQAAAADLTHNAAVQTVLTLTGFWPGAIDGVWTDELTAALQAFQMELGVEPTGFVDSATMVAFQQAIAERQASPTPTTTGAPTTTMAPATTGAPITTVAGTPAATTPVTTATAPIADGEATVLVAESDLGQILTAANGMTVYLFTPDAQGTPTCTESCALAWPPVTVGDADQVTAGDGVDASLLGTTAHPAAGTQVTYNDWPLYVFTGDVATGDTNGQGQGGAWYVLDPTGNPLGDD